MDGGGVVVVVADSVCGPVVLGRCPQDVCYSFWAGALLPVCGRAELLDDVALVRYILAVSQQGLLPQDQPPAGFSDKPGAPPDYYHTCYALSGLAVARHHGKGRAGKARFEVKGAGEGAGLLPRQTDLLLNVCTDRLQAWDGLIAARRAAEERAGSDRK